MTERKLRTPFDAFPKPGPVSLAGVFKHVTDKPEAESKREKEASARGAGGVRVRRELTAFRCRVSGEREQGQMVAFREKPRTGNRRHESLVRRRAHVRGLQDSAQRRRHIRVRGRDDGRQNGRRVGRRSRKTDVRPLSVARHE